MSRFRDALIGDSNTDAGELLWPIYLPDDPGNWLDAGRSISEAQELLKAMQDTDGMSAMHPMIRYEGSNPGLAWSVGDGDGKPLSHASFECLEAYLDETSPWPHTVTVTAHKRRTITASEVDGGRVLDEIYERLDEEHGDDGPYAISSQPESLAVKQTAELLATLIAEDYECHWCDPVESFEVNVAEWAEWYGWPREDWPPIASADTCRCDKPDTCVAPGLSGASAICGSCGLFAPTDTLQIAAREGCK